MQVAFCLVAVAIIQHAGSRRHGNVSFVFMMASVVQSTLCTYIVVQYRGGLLWYMVPTTLSIYQFILIRQVHSHFTAVIRRPCADVLTNDSATLSYLHQRNPRSLPSTNADNGGLCQHDNICSICSQFPTYAQRILVPTLPNNDKCRRMTWALAILALTAAVQRPRFSMPWQKPTARSY